MSSDGGAGAAASRDIGSLKILSMMGAGIPPNVAHFNKDKLGVKYPVLLKFGSTMGEVAQDLLLTMALSAVKSGKNVQFVTERPITRLPLQGPKKLPPPPELLSRIDFWYCKTLRSLCKVFGRLHDLEDLPDMVIMHDLEGMLQDSDRFPVDLARCCGMIAQTFEYARQEKEIPFFVSCPRSPIRDSHQSMEDRHRFVEIPFNDYFPTVWKLKAVTEKTGVVSLKTDRGLEVFLKVDKSDGLAPTRMRMPAHLCKQ